MSQMKFHKFYASMTVKAVFLLIMIQGVSVEVSSDINIFWTTDGRILSGNNEIKLKMHNAYSGYRVDNGIYVIGFEIDKQGNNKPTLSWLKNINVEPVYWSFDNVLQQVFEFDGHVYLLDMQGDVYKHSKSEWTKEKFNLVKKSRIIDTKNGILACYPSSFMMSSQRSGACYMVDASWKVQVNWRDIEPKICNGNLVVVDTQQKQMMFKKYSVLDGKLIDTRKIFKVSEDLCKVKLE